MMIKVCFSQHRQRRALALLLILLLTTISATARSRYMSAKFMLTAEKDQKTYVDSIVSAQPGVFSARWSPRRQMLVVVYDKTLTSRHHLKIFVTRLSAQLPTPEADGKACPEQRRSSICLVV